MTAEPARGSGSRLERTVFNFRSVVVALCAIVTLAMGLSLRDLTLSASFERTIPLSHPFLQNYAKHRDDIHSQGNALRIVVESTRGQVFEPAYLETLKRMNDAVFLLPGVDRSFMRSLWTTSTRWVGVTEEGFEGGPVIPSDYDGSPAAAARVRVNVERSGEIGQLVAGDLRSSVILAPLLERDPAGGGALDYRDLSHRLETLRTQFAPDGVRVRITGFAKVMGDLIDGLHAMLAFFALSVAIATGAVFWFTRCPRSTALVVACSLIAVVWQLGMLPLLGVGLDPYSILVPFLIFAIGMSHGAQKMNGVMQDVGRGMTSLGAARMTFRRLFAAGLTALVCDAVGFAVLMVIDIEAIRSLALVASLGVAILIFTNLILLPVLLSYVGVGRAPAARSLAGETAAAEGRASGPLWRVLDTFTQPAPASAAIAAAIALAAFGAWAGAGLQIGDLDSGAPELRQDSVYNRDNQYLTAHYATSSDVLVAMVSTPQGACADYRTEREVDMLEQRLRELPGVEGTASLAGLSRRMTSALNEASPLWSDLVPNQMVLNSITQAAPREFLDSACDLLPIYVFLRDHKARTLSQTTATVRAFAAEHDRNGVHFLLAAGNAGVEAATNEVVEGANRTILIYVYAAVALLALVTFRSLAAVAVAMLPLALTSILAEALMVQLGIGVKVATLPVTAIGVGIGVDYALYILSVTRTGLRAGLSLSDAYRRALLFTGRVVLLTGVTLSAAVATWAFSPIRFQADMGLLLAFMFLLNMAGALVLTPALACFLLRARKTAAPVRAMAGISRSSSV